MTSDIAFLAPGIADYIERHTSAPSELERRLIDLVVDLAFIDADETGYLGYLELLIPHMSGRSVVLVDNVLWDGRVVDDDDRSSDTVALREFNRAVVENESLEVALLPIGDGLSMITLGHD